MKRHTVIIFIAIGLLAFMAVAFVLSERGTQLQEQIYPVSVAGPDERQQSQEPGLLRDEQEAARIAAMRAEYARLEDARNALRLQLGRLQARIWTLQLPPGQAEMIAEQLRRGYGILKSPPLLGAFADRAGINAEVTRVSHVQQALLELEAELFEGQVRSPEAGGTAES